MELSLEVKRWRWWCNIISISSSTTGVYISFSVSFDDFASVLVNIALPGVLLIGASISNVVGFFLGTETKRQFRRSVTNEPSGSSGAVERMSQAAVQAQWNE